MNPKLKVDLEADSSKLDATLSKVDSKVKKAVNQKATAGGAGGAAAAAAEGGPIGIAAGTGLALAAASAVMVKHTMDYADHLADLSDMTNIAVDDIDALAKSAAGAGKDVDSALKMVNEMQESRVKALQGDDAKMAAFERLGISREKLQNTDNIAKLLGGVNSQGSENRSALSEIVGKKSLGLFTAIQEDLKDWENFKAKLKEQGRLIDPEQVRTVEEFNDTVREVKESLMGMLLPWITTALRGLLDAFYWFKDEFKVLTTGLFAALDLMPSFWSVVKDLLLFPFLHPKEFLIGGLPAALESLITDDMVAGFDEAIAKVQEEIDEERAAREAKRKKANEGKEVLGAAAPVVNTKPLEEEKFKPLDTSVNDSMVAVGNFLGSDVGSLQSIGEQQIDRLDRQIVIQNQINNGIEKLIERLNNTGWLVG